MKKRESNYAFIDAQNLYMGIERLGWKMDYVKFLRYLQEKYKVTTAYIFIGFVQENQVLYQFLQKAGYILIFRQTVEGENHKVKGNVDVDLVMQAMIDIEEYDNAVIVTSDGDFYPFIKYLYEKGKLKTVISPYRRTCSKLIKVSAKEKISFLDRLKTKLMLKKTEGKNKKETSD